jgi:hypothetical protein
MSLQQGIVGRGWVSSLVVIVLGALSSGDRARAASSRSQAREQESPQRAPSSTTLTGSTCVWTDIPSPDTGAPHNAFYGVTALSANNVWAVGAYDVFGTGGPKQLIAHWNGMSWNQIATPSLPSSDLRAISAVGPSDIWAVGGKGGEALIEHWNGSSWSVVSQPNPGTFNRFFGVAAVSGQDAWAVGQFNSSGLAQTLVQRWNGSSWSIVPSPNVPNQHNQLNAITAVPGSSELWAVGSAGPSQVILRWNGAQWSLAPSPNPGINPNLTGVVALSPNDVWAVGFTSSGSGVVETLIEHWDGSTWSVVPSPNPSATYNHLMGVAAAGPNDVWAVGDYNGPGGRTLMLHWDGAAWSHVPGDDKGPQSLPFSLNAVDAVANGDVWSVGTNSHSLAEHWNGASWTQVATPNAGTGVNQLYAVSGTSPSDVWQVGSFEYGVERRTLTQHWNGASWELVRSPNTNKNLNELRGVAALSPTNAWAVGHAYSSDASNQTTLVLNWDGADWSIVPSPSPGTAGQNELFAISAVSPTDIWAVGARRNVNGWIQTLTLHYDGVSWKLVPSANVPNTNNGLYGVTALAKDDVWAVGYFGQFAFSPLVLHWNGQSWSVVSNPDPQQSSNILYAASGTGGSDVWAVGTAKNLFTNMVGPMLEHWDGTDWSLVFPAQGAPSALYGVASSFPADAWQVGDSSGLAFIGRWNGDSWKLSPSPNIAGRLHATTAIAPGDVWAVGFRYVDGQGFRTLSEHFVCDLELFCFCESGGACSNPDPDAGCANSTAAGALLFHASGSISVSSDDLVLATAQLPANKLGLAFMGGAPANSPFHDGRLCIGPGSAGIFRYPLQSSGASGVMALGPGIVAQSQSFLFAGRIQPGSTWFFQTWYRDPTGPCGTGSNLSNAARVSFQP